MNIDKQDFLLQLQRDRLFDRVGDVRVKTKCILCGDSKKDPNKKRLYILCDPYDNDVVTYICFNCGEYGLLTVDMLGQIVGEDAELLNLLRRINRFAKSDSKNKKVNKYKNNRVIPVELPSPRKTPQTIAKIRYLNNRIGYPIPVEDYKKLKLVFSIQDFLAINNILVPKKYQFLIPQFETDYVGFLSVKNEYLILRDITGKHKDKFRYVKYNLFGIQSNAHAFYTISNTVNTISQQPIHIIMAEGPMDILSVIYNMYGGIVPDNVFISTNNGTFYHPAMYYINKGLVGSNIFVDIYRDSDSIMDYQLLRKQIRPFTKNFKVYRNAIGKDFGVPKDQYEIIEEY